MKFKSFFFLTLLAFCGHSLTGQVTPFNLFSPRFNSNTISFIDLDHDGDPDVLRTFINDSIPVQWIDDDDDMITSDLQGNMDNDCLMIDRNRDGSYGGELDLIIDWCDENRDGRADLQIVADNAKLSDKGWTPGHFMISIDTDNDQVFNYIDWKTLKLEPWDHQGQSRFFQDYSGKTMFLKIHTSSFNIHDLRYNWENPFLFYDPDKDGLSEMALRFMDIPAIDSKRQYPVILSKKVTDVRFSIDLDNDSRSENDFDYDMSLKFTGDGFDYSNHVHKYKSLRGLPEADTFFIDPRWRQMTELIYVDHEKAFDAAFKNGNWSQCWLVYDEDDDCQRWERVEFYEPKDPGRIGANNGGLDNNPQADATGDRGEWDQDFSGKGNLYVGKFDGLIHLYGAERGAWRIDQNARYFQGWQGWRGGGDGIPNDSFVDEPSAFPTIKYSDTDGNGFTDRIEYDLNGDLAFETVISLRELGINDRCDLRNPADMKYRDYRKMFAVVSEDLWARTRKALVAARKNNLAVQWYSLLLNPQTAQEKYYCGYWLTFSIWLDLRNQGLLKNDPEFIRRVDRACFSGDWDLLN